MSKYHDLYLTSGGSIGELTWLSKSYGYDNPGPIVAYPLNESIFRPDQSPGMLPPAVDLYVPWHPTLLTKWIVTAENIALDAGARARRMIGKVSLDREEIEGFLTTIDAVNVLAQFGTGLVKLSIAGKEVGEGAKSLSWFLAEEATRRAEMVFGIGPLFIPVPSKPKRDFQFVLRHMFGAWNPSYWASIWGAFEEGDADLYLFGSAAQASKQQAEIKRQADQQIAFCLERVRNLRSQLEEEFYEYRG